MLAVSIKNIKCQVEKKARAEINPKEVVSPKYHDFFNDFFKKVSNTPSPHQKCLYKIQ